jgi:hypothetical protein
MLTGQEALVAVCALSQPQAQPQKPISLTQSGPVTLPIALSRTVQPRSIQ